MKATDSNEQLSKTKQEIQDNQEPTYEYTLEAGIPFTGQRVIIPKILQKPILHELHRHYKDKTTCTPIRLLERESTDIEQLSTIYLQ
jgi:hypothetical protein